MTIGIPKEVKVEEYRVGILPDTVSLLAQKGHQVLVGKSAGLGAGIRDEDYERAGAEIVSEASRIYRRSELVVKVKEPQPAEYQLLHEGQIVFTFFHFAANLEMTKVLLEKKVDCIAYELVEKNGCLPILTPMSEIAGRLAPQQTAKYLEKEYGGKGVLLSGATGVKPGKVVIIGGGVVGFNAATISAGLGAQVVILEINEKKIKYLKKNLPANCKVVPSSRENIKKETKDADAVIGAVLISGARSPILLKREDLKEMEPGTVLIDVAIDQGGCFETSRPTTHRNPVYLLDGIVHYCVANMPGGVPRTSTYALSYATAPYVLLLAEKGNRTTEQNPDLKKGLAIHNGKIVAKSLSEILSS
ncbi:MAG: alanine dehydrogenase [Candidatus Omnitrophota bacterium]